MTTPYGPFNAANSRAQQVPDNSGSETFPTAHEVADFHRNADTNKRPEAIHHSLGTGHNQASFGDHIHDGSTGVQLLPVTDLFSQNLGTPQGQKDAINQILNILARLGAINATNVSGQYPEIRTGSLTATWGTTGQLSNVLPFTFSTPMSGVPALVMTCRSTNATIQYLAMQAAGLTSAGTSLRVWSSGSITSGGTCPVDYIAVFMKPYI